MVLLFILTFIYLWLLWCSKDQGMLISTSSNLRTGPIQKKYLPWNSCCRNFSRLKHLLNEVGSVDSILWLFVCLFGLIMWSFKRVCYGRNRGGRTFPSMTIMLSHRVEGLLIWITPPYATTCVGRLWDLAYATWSSPSLACLLYTSRCV